MNDVLKELSWPLKLKVLNELPGILDKGKPPTLPPPIIDEYNHRKDPFPVPALPLPHEKAPIPGTPGNPAPIPGESPLPGDSPMPSQNPVVASKVSSELPQPSDVPGAITTPGGFLADHGEKLTTLAQISVSDVPGEAVHRRVGVERLTARRDDGDAHDSADDNDMRLKLFRLMYETVRDSDLKVKRAELIKEHYINSTTFEIGYLVGDITDKASIISDISMTLKRFYSEWKPIEHINAYEQIANQAIEITHLIDLVRIVNKKDKDSGSRAGSYTFKKK